MVKVEVRCLKVEGAGKVTTMQVATLAPGEETTGKRCQICRAALGNCVLACIKLINPEVLKQIDEQIPEELMQNHPNFPRELKGKGGKSVRQDDVEKVRNQIQCSMTIFPQAKS